METLNILHKRSGAMWHRKAIPTKDEGLVLIVKSTQNIIKEQSNRQIRFQCIAFHAVVEEFLASDYHGNIYLFDIYKNRYKWLLNCGKPCTAISYCLHRKSEYLVALSDSSLNCYDTDTNELIAVLKAHESPVTAISVHSSGKYAITSASDTAHLWDLNTFERIKQLKIKEDVGLLTAFFLPSSNNIITCFKDDNIFAWEALNLNCKYQLHRPENTKGPIFKTFAVSKDGKFLTAAGKSKFLYTWNLESQQLLPLIELPQKITSIKKIQYLPSNFEFSIDTIIGLLSSSGIMYFVNLTTCKQLFSIGTIERQIEKVDICKSGYFSCCISKSGDIHLFDLKCAAKNIHMPSPGVIKIAETNKNKNANTLRSKTKPIEQDGDIADGLSTIRLKRILDHYGEYPAKYRAFIWRQLLRLPENHDSFESLLAKGLHPSLRNLHELIPLKSRKLLRILQKLMCCLAHWSPIFGETDFLATLVFPFVKLLQNNQLCLFEITTTFLINWCYHWFEYFPNPPINVLGTIENVLAHNDKELLSHLIRKGVTTQVYAWPILQTIFSEVLTREEWLQFFDHVFTNDPSFLLLAVAAYCICSRSSLLHTTELEDFEYFFHNRNPISISSFIKEIYRLNNVTPRDIHPKIISNTFQPLIQGSYPVFNKYPIAIVDYQAKERQRILEEEMEIVKQRKMVYSLRDKAASQRNEHESWLRQQQHLCEAEEKRRQLLNKEEKRLEEQRTRLTALQREVKMTELSALDATRRKALAMQQQEKESQIARLDDELRRTVLRREAETENACDDAEVKRLELELQRAMLENELQREFSGYDNKHKVNDAVKDLADIRSEALADKFDYNGVDDENKKHKDLGKMQLKRNDIEKDKEIRNAFEGFAEHEFTQSAKVANLTESNSKLQEQVIELSRRLERQYKSNQALENAIKKGFTQNNTLQTYNAGNYSELVCDPLNENSNESSRFNSAKAHSSKKVLNDSFDVDADSVQFSISSSRESRSKLEKDEAEMMTQVRDMRRRLLSEYTKKPPIQLPT